MTLMHYNIIVIIIILKQLFGSNPEKNRDKVGHKSYLNKDSRSRVHPFYTQKWQP